MQIRIKQLQQVNNCIMIALYFIKTKLKTKQNKNRKNKEKNPHLTD